MSIDTVAPHTPVAHPLDPLSTDEVTRAVGLLRAGLRPSGSFDRNPLGLPWRGGNGHWHTDGAGR